jgi:hypothetical protein
LPGFARPWYLRGAITRQEVSVKRLALCGLLLAASAVAAPAPLPKGPAVWQIDTRPLLAVEGGNGRLGILVAGQGGESLWLSVSIVGGRVWGSSATFSAPHSSGAAIVNMGGSFLEPLAEATLRAMRSLGEYVTVRVRSGVIDVVDLRGGPIEFVTVTAEGLERHSMPVVRLAHKRTR